LSSPKVAILLCSYQGEHYLSEQLQSFAVQTFNNWHVWASDDRSKDNTCRILEDYRNKWEGKLSLISGQGKGFVVNFLSATCRKEIQADYYAYSDQDDIWEADKLERAVRWLRSIPDNVPTLYCSRTCFVDADNNEIGLSPLFSKPPSFLNALVQSIAGGNTMVFNNATRELLRQSGEKIPVARHDWWTYLVVTGCGGQVFYDPYPSLRYRQHNNNLIGMSRCVDRIILTLHGCFRTMVDNNIQSLKTLENRLISRNQEVLDRFVRAREMSLLPRLKELYKIGVYRQSLLENLGFIMLSALKKV
jgi:glycosyltransferase involved in cell wall biosynthesis